MNPRHARVLFVAFALAAVADLAMAYRATRLSLTAALGGALFMLSDTLIATGVAEWPQLPRPEFWIMATYLAAQLLLAHGVMSAVGGRRTPVTSESAPAAP